MPATTRRRRGVHYTPSGLATQVVAIAVDEFVRANGRLPRSVCDPTCGAGAFLLAAAEELHQRGMATSTILGEVLSGVEIDPGAAAAARVALSVWGDEHGSAAAVDPRRIVVADAVATEPADWPGRPDDGFDLVIGNPPFLSQLASDTARRLEERERLRDRFGDIGAYADAAALLLAAGVDLLAPGGIAAMVQPVSVLSARDAAVLRERVIGRCSMSALWTSDEQHFDAAVIVCVPVLLAGGTASLTRVHSDGGVVEVAAPVGDRWARLGATAAGVPDVSPLGRRSSAADTTLGALFGATAGFRDEFYAIGAAIHAEPGSPLRDASPRVISTGMIDPHWCRWPHGDHRIAGRRWHQPRLDVAALDAAAPSVGEWTRRRLRPKVLVATQTKIVEAVVDAAGDMVPLTPVLSVEPHDRSDLWKVAAALAAPPNVARLAALQWGSGRSAQSLRIPARRLGELPMPLDLDAWNHAAGLLADAPDGEPAPELLIDVGRHMTVAYGLAPDHTVLDWWVRRLPARLGVTAEHLG